MPEYLMSVEMEEDYPTVKELAIKLATDYGVVNYKGMPHEPFVRAYLEENLRDRNMKRLMKPTVPKVYVYPNSDALFEMVEEMLPELEDEKGLSVPIRDVSGSGKIKYWRVFWRDSFSAHKKMIGDIHSFRVYRKGKNNCEIA